jgi:CheY-like chemotaxis protein
LEATLTAETSQPDLILLDIELSTLYGIEAARRIHIHTHEELAGCDAGFVDILS